MYVIIIEYDNCGAEAFGPYDTEAAAENDFESVKSDAGDDYHITNMGIQELQR